MRQYNRPDIASLSDLGSYTKGALIGFFYDGAFGNVEGAWGIIKTGWRLKQYYSGVQIATRWWKGDLFEAERKNIEQGKKYAKMAYDITQALGTELGEEAFRQYDAMQSGDPTRLRELGSEHRQVAALMLGLVVELQRKYKDLPAEMKGRIVGAVTWEIAQTTAEIVLTGGASKAATGSAKFAALAAKLQKFDKAKDIAAIIQKLFVKGGKLDKLMGKLDEIASGVNEVRREIARVGEVIENLCFTPETLVSTSTGLKQLGRIEPGEFVHAFDFASGQWMLSEVQQRHDNRYSGEMVTIAVGDSRIECTANHPFWVVEGERLDHRTRPTHLNPQEDEGLSLGGRWINSQDLLPGDAVVCHDGRSRNVASVECRDVSDIAVCNLTVRDQHSFAVGEAAVLVHNIAWCTVLEKVPGLDAARNQLLKRWPGGKIHAHHIVQKQIPDEFFTKQINGKLIKDFAAPDPSWSRTDQKAWYIGKSHKILEDAKIPRYGSSDFPDALGKVDDVKAIKAMEDSIKALGGSVDDLDKLPLNMTWAVNGKGTHRLETVKEVYERLARAKQELEPDAVASALREMGEIFMRKGTLLEPM